MAEKHKLIILIPFLIIVLFLNGCNKSENKNGSVSTGKDSSKRSLNDSSTDQKNNLTESKKEELSGNFLRPIRSADAPSYVGQKVLIKGNVAQVVARSKVVYLNIDGKFPKNKFCAVVFSDKLKLFNKINEYEGKEVEIEGVISKYKDKFEIILNDPAMIRMAQK